MTIWISTLACMIAGAAKLEAQSRDVEEATHGYGAVHPFPPDGQLWNKAKKMLHPSIHPTIHPSMHPIFGHMKKPIQSLNHACIRSFYFIRECQSSSAKVQGGPQASAQLA